MFGFIKKAFGKSDSGLPPGIAMPDEAMSQLAGATASMVSMQLVMTDLDGDPGNWTRDERATVMGYIDGQVSVFYQHGDPKMPLASIVSAVTVFKERRPADRILSEREYFVSEQDPTFMRAAHRGWEDAKNAFSEQQRSPLGLVELLNPGLANS
ncbi:hypothetical protein [Variovorax boronicumulans]